MTKNKTKISAKVLSTLAYLKSVVDKDNEEWSDLVVSISKDGTVSMATDDMTLIAPETAKLPGHNPLQGLLDHINDEMCTDCITQDWLYKHSYFSSLVRSYIDSLIHEFGSGVAIPKELARAILIHQVSDYVVMGKSGDDGIVFNSAYGTFEDKYKDTNWTFYLEA